MLNLVVRRETAGLLKVKVQCKEHITGNKLQANTAHVSFYFGICTLNLNLNLIMLENLKFV
jgi:hypothetical protein